MTVPNDVLTIWLPVALTALMAIIGLLRGVGRELVVAAAITLGALIVQQWAAIWAAGIQESFTSTNVGVAQFSLGLIVLSAVTLLVGYLLGGRLAERPSSASMRLLGGILGAMNGAALAGWILRYAYVSLDGAQPSSPVYQNSVSQGFMIWAGWFPVVLAVMGGLYALISPFRRAREVVERPSDVSDWGPSVPRQAGSDERIAATPVGTGAATVALPMSDVRPPQPRDMAETQPVPMWEKPRADVPEQIDIEPGPVHSTASMVTQEASWLGGQEPSTSTTTGFDGAPASTPATTSLPISDSSESLMSSSSSADSKCTNCGADMLPGAVFCTNCGTRVR